MKLQIRHAPIVLLHTLVFTYLSNLSLQKAHLHNFGRKPILALLCLSCHYGTSSLKANCWSLLEKFVTSLKNTHPYSFGSTTPAQEGF